MNILINKIKQSIGFHFTLLGGDRGNNLSEGLKGSNILGSIALLLIFSLFSCTDDPEFNNRTEMPEDTLTISIPDVEGAAEFGATRSDEFQNTRAVSESAEGEISSIWLFAYPVDNNGETYITSLYGHNSLTITFSENGYKNYTITGLKHGKYRIYLLANLDNYLPSGLTLSASMSEEQLKKILIEFSSSKPLVKNNLPMYCLNTQIKNSPNTVVQNGEFDYQSSNDIIYADMKFLCAKVRYTILFDRSEGGFSYQFSSNNVNFTKAVGNNLAPQTLLTTEGTINNNKTWSGNLSLNPVRYPNASNGTQGYLNISDIKNQSDSPSNLTVISVNDWYNSARRAWQGVAYLPQNLHKDSFDDTYITVTGNGTELSSNEYKFNFTEESGRELEKGQMYDIVAKLKKTEFEVECNISPWDVKELAYTLHGPYELVVEKTSLELKSGSYATNGFRTDTSLSFDIPTVKYKTSTGEILEIPFYVPEFIDDNSVDENGDKYDFSADSFKDHFRVSINPKLPYVILYDLQNGGYTFNEDGENINYTKESLGYFHVVAGNLHKKIDVNIGMVGAYLNVYPESINIETRTYYMSANDNGETFPITFDTNYEVSNGSVDFYFYDKAALVKGKGERSLNGDYDMQLLPCEGIDKESVYQNYYPISVNNGVLQLNIANLIGGHEFWDVEHEFELVFTLNVWDPRDPSKTTTIEKITRTVKIYVKPYSTNYIIHFYDKTHTWANPPHIFIYQDLLMPSDLLKDKNDRNSGVSMYAGKIVGYIENYNGFNWNAAAKNVFTNNVSFRGWDGYGGPTINDPYNKKEQLISGGDYDGQPYNCNKYTQGFVMLGESIFDGQHSWNDDYGYTARNSKRNERYRYDVNYNADHEARMNKYITKNGKDFLLWDNCTKCKSDYNNGSIYVYNDRDYPGIVMEEEGNGWWRYVLSGVAQPGKTMIIFADTHEPWTTHNNNWNNVENDYRYPAAYETGLTLFDFEDNEGWFVFSGRNYENGPTPTSHYFYDDKEEAEKHINSN